MTGPEDEVTLLENPVHKHWKGGLVSSQRCDTEEDLCCKSKQTPQPNLQDLDFWQAAQRGILNRVTLLVESGEVNVTDRDAGKVTALHWAAINNHIAVAKYLLDKGAEIDALGGDLVATPFHWAARSGHTQMVTLLYKRGADLYLKDSQGYNALHLAVHAGQAMMIVYLLAIGMDVDTRDTMQRTPLMWSAYQGNSLEGMSELLRNNPNLDNVDITGYTALHWAVISGHLEFAKKLLEEGASHTVKDPEGKTPGDWAQERQTHQIYNSILEEVKTGQKSKQKLNKTRRNQIIYAIPYLALPFSFWFLGKFAIYFSLPILGFLYYHLQNFIGRVLLKGDTSLIPTTPLTSSLLHASLFYVFIGWLRVLPTTSYLYGNHILFIVSLVTCCYSLYKASSIDPGFVKQSATIDEKNDIVNGLAEIGRLTPRDYCVTCRIRKPLRSKHCKICNRCVAKLDHHCPWTNNCIGVLNHRYFMVFSIALVIGAFQFCYIAMAHISELLDNGVKFDPSAQFGQCLFGELSCGYLQSDFWTISIAFWAFLQALWVSFLVVSQSYQIMIGYTTNEAVNHRRFDYLVHPDDLTAPAYRRRTVNPFNIGFIGNCVDFWSNGAGQLKDVSWFSIYDVPSYLMDKSLRRNGYARVSTKSMDDIV